MNETSLPLLKNHFGLATFRPGQKEILASVLAGRDSLAVLPTGGGKSLCYQFPAITENKLVVVISPLIALMKDQVASLERKGIRAGAIHSGQGEEEKKKIFRAIEAGGSFVLYISPERVQKDGFKRWIKEQKIALFAVDEAHCISQWGHDFREEYGQLKVLKELRPEVPVLALTASATPLVLQDISRRLSLKTPSRHVHGFYRPNLYYQVEICENEPEKLALLEAAIWQVPTGRILVYCGTRRATEEVAGTLGRKFAAVGFYHAGLGSEERTRVQKAYSENQIRVLVATNAFGMGIDHPDVRLVVHFHMPANIDALYQEMGRAGRDGKPSTCLMLYSKKDKGLQSFFIQSSEAPEEIKRSRWNTLDALVNYAEGSECRHGEILTYYQDSQRLESCGHCDSCLPLSDRKIQRPPPAAIAPAAPKKGRTPKKREEENVELDSAQKWRFQELKEWRKQKAKELDLPAFMIFSDRTLRQLACHIPHSKGDLGKIYGIGEAKIDSFGAEVLALCTGWK